jgi:hypothetical protein
MWSIVVLVVVVGGAIGAASAVLRLRERRRRAAHLDYLRPLVQAAGEPELATLDAHARSCHNEGPGPATAEAWYALGCARLAAGQPEPATRAFQLCCHAHAGMESAVLLAFACLKTRAEDMPQFRRIVEETYDEIHRPPIPATHWERDVLTTLGLVSPPPTGSPRTQAKHIDLAALLTSIKQPAT